MKKNYTGYTDISNTLNILRKININEAVEEGDENKKDNEKYGVKEGSESVPYTKSDEMMKNITETAKTQFGASFEGFENPMLYYPEDGDVVLCGKIPSLNNLLFQYRYLDSNGGCYIWTSPLTLNRDVITKLNRIFGVYDNWKKELSSAKDIKPMSYKKDE